MNLNVLPFVINTKDLLFVKVEEKFMFLKLVHTYDKVVSPKGGDIHFELCNTHHEIYHTIVNTRSYYLF